MTQSDATSLRMIRAALAAMILCDLLFIGLHLVHAATWRLPSRSWSIERDGGHAEWWQYAKYVMLTLVLTILAIRMRTPLLFGWAMLFAFMMLDDSLRLHEQAGLLFAERVQLSSIGALRDRDLGELLFAGSIGAVVCPMLLIGYLRGRPLSREMTKDLAIILLGIVVCGVGIDALHELITNGHAKVAVTMMEDGGEMLLLSVALFYAAQYLPASGVVQFRPMVEIRALLMRMRLKEVSSHV